MVAARNFGSGKSAATAVAQIKARPGNSFIFITPLRGSMGCCSQSGSASREKSRAFAALPPYVPPLCYGNDSTFSRAATATATGGTNLRVALRRDVLRRGATNGGRQSTQFFAREQAGNRFATRHRSL